MKTLTPFGVKDLLPHETKHLEGILNSISKIFENWKYQKIITPTIEYYDSLAHAMGEYLNEKTIKFFDAEGQTLILRPDYTTPIARVVATRLKEEKKPLRLFYIDSVFRKADKHTHEDFEITQAGIECIGDAGPESETEVISICCEVLKKLGFTDFGIDIGHIDFVENLSTAEKKALMNGNYLEYGKIPERGGVEIVQQHPELLRLYQNLKKKGYDKYVSFNKGLIKDISYYSGIIFECFVKNTGRIIGSGGRYDNLVSKFGYDIPAIGFSLDVNLLLNAIKYENK